MTPLALSVGSDRHSRKKLRRSFLILSVEQERSDPVFTIVIMEARVRRVVPIRDGSLSNIEPKESISAFYRLVDLRIGNSALPAKDK